MLHPFRPHWSAKRRAAAMVELAVLVIAICVLAIVALGKDTSGVFQNDAQKITNKP